MDKLPVELTTAIVESMNLRDAEKLYKEIQGHHTIYEEALKQRLDPVRYLRKLTAEPEQFMVLMDKYECIVADSNVTPYFFPNIPTTDKTWRLICNRRKTRNFICESKQIGMIWRNYNHGMQKISWQYAPSSGVVHIGFSRNYNGQYIKIELVELSSNVPYHALVEIPLTVDQCFISSRVACHMYYTRTDSGNMIVWSNNISSNTCSLLISGRSRVFRRCQSCYGLIVGQYGRLTLEFAQLMMNIRYTIRAINGIESEKRKYAYKLLQDTEKHYNEVHNSSIWTDGDDTLLPDSSMDDIVDKIVSECICDYDTDMSDIIQYRTTSLNVVANDIEHKKQRCIEDNDAYMYTYGIIDENTDERLIWPKWTEEQYQIEYEDRWSCM